MKGNEGVWCVNKEEQLEFGTRRDRGISMRGIAQEEDKDLVCKQAKTINKRIPACVADEN